VCVWGGIFAGYTNGDVELLGLISRIDKSKEMNKQTTEVEIQEVCTLFFLRASTYGHCKLKQVRHFLLKIGNTFGGRLY
jgi:hypothetical protein